MNLIQSLFYRAQHAVLSSADEGLIRIELEKRLRRDGIKNDGQASANIIPYYEPQRAVTLQEWRYALDLAKSPYSLQRGPLYGIYERVMIDLELSRLMNKQAERLQKAKYRLVKPDGTEDPDAIKLFENLWWWDYVRYVLEADAYGHSLIELWEMKDKPTQFTVNGKKTNVLELKKAGLVDRKHVKPEFGLWVVEEKDTMGYSYRTPEMAPYYIEAEGDEKLGFLHKVAPLEISKRYAIGTWSEFNEKIAFPFRWAIMPSGNKVRQNAMASILQNMGSAGWGIFHKDEEVKLLEMSKSDPHKCFMELISYVDRKLEGFIEGEGLKNEMGEGSFAADKVRSDMKDERYLTNKVYLEYFSNSELLPRLVKMGYPLAGYKLECDEKRDIPVETQIDIDSKLLAHYRIKPEFIASRYGIPVDAIQEKAAQGAGNLADLLESRKKPNASMMFAQAIEAENHAQAFSNCVEYYEDACCGHSHAQMAEPWPDFSKWMEDFARRVFDRELKAGQIDDEVFRQIEGILYQQVQAGYGKKLASLEYGTPDHILLSNLLHNSSVFAAFKNHQNVRQLASLLVDDEGKERTYSQFRELAQPLNEEYNRNWMQAEYQTAKASARMAANWQRMESEGVRMLKYETAGDERVRLVHRAFDGITLPMSDDFWNQHYPPNGWRCRCDAYDAGDNALQVEAPADLPAVKDGFGHNPGKSGMIFDNEHPYIKGASAKAKREVNSYIEANVVRNFAPATSIKEAEEFAVNSGIAESASYKGVALEKANAINRHLMRLKLTAEKSFNSIGTENMAEAVYMASQHDEIANTHALVININKIWKGLDYDNSRLSLMKGWTVVSNIEGAVSHEFGHLLTAELTASLPDDFKRATTLPISEYAKESLDETLSEIFALYIYGGEISQEARDLFNQYSSFKI